MHLEGCWNLPCTASVIAHCHIIQSLNSAVIGSVTPQQHQSLTESQLMITLIRVSIQCKKDCFKIIDITCELNFSKPRFVGQQRCKMSQSYQCDMWSIMSSWSLLPTYCFIYLFAYLLTYLLAYLLTCLLACLLYLLTDLLSCLLAYLLTYLFTYLPTYLLNYLLTYLLTYFLT